MDISSNYIEDVSSLSFLPKECEVWCYNNPVIDWKPLQHINALNSDVPGIEVNATFNTETNPIMATAIASSPFDIEWIGVTWSPADDEEFEEWLYFESMNVIMLEVPQRPPGTYSLYLSAKDANNRIIGCTASSADSNEVKWKMFEFEITR